MQTERGRAGLKRARRAFCNLLWKLWSPTWKFDEATFERTAQSFDNPDFVDVVIHSYRHRFGVVAGDPNYDEIEQRLARQPDITVPTVTLDGATDGIRPAGTAAQAVHFTGRHEHRVIQNAGHNISQEAPRAFVEAVLTVHKWQVRPRSCIASSTLPRRHRSLHRDPAVVAEIRPRAGSRRRSHFDIGNDFPWRVPELGIFRHDLQ